VENWGGGGGGGVYGVHEARKRVTDRREVRFLIETETLTVLMVRSSPANPLRPLIRD
jgi:hypothetical protein